MPPVEWARALSENGDYPTAIIELKNILQVDPSNLEARYLLGKVYLQDEQVDNAIKELERAMASGLSQNQVLEPLGRAYLLADQPQKILDGLEIPSDSAIAPPVLTLRGEAYLSLDHEIRATVVQSWEWAAWR